MDGGERVTTFELRRSVVTDDSVVVVKMGVVDGTVDNVPLVVDVVIGVVGLLDVGVVIESVVVGALLGVEDDDGTPVLAVTRKLTFTSSSLDGVGGGGGCEASQNSLK